MMFETILAAQGACTLPSPKKFTALIKEVKISYALFKFNSETSRPSRECGYVLLIFGCARMTCSNFLVAKIS